MGPGLPGPSPGSATAYGSFEAIICFRFNQRSITKTLPVPNCSSQIYLRVFPQELYWRVVFLFIGLIWSRKWVSVNLHTCLSRHSYELLKTKLRYCPAYFSHPCVLLKHCGRSFNSGLDFRFVQNETASLPLYN